MNFTPTHEDPEAKAAAAAYMKQAKELRATILADRAAGEAALRRLLPIAQGATGQCERVARILLGLYNGHRFPLNLLNLRSLDHEILNDVLAVLRMDADAYQEVHRYFDNGSDVFEKLAEDWGFEKGGAK